MLDRELKKGRGREGWRSLRTGMLSFRRAPPPLPPSGIRSAMKSSPQRLSGPPPTVAALRAR